MRNAADLAREVLVVLDPDFGDRFRHAWRGQAAWITMSPANTPVVLALRANRPSHNHSTEITGFKHEDGTTGEDQFLALLDTIDLHHGPYSTSTPYTVLTVIGARLTEAIRAGLSDLGFSMFQERLGGFSASRSEDEAHRLRS